MPQARRTVVFTGPFLGFHVSFQERKFLGSSSFRDEGFKVLAYGVPGLLGFQGFGV